MRLKMILPVVDPTVIADPAVCPHGCGGTYFKLRQVVTKPLRDTKLAEVEARRYDCLRCGRTFRVYPRGVSSYPTSSRLRGLGVMLYLLGLSYGAAALVLTALGHPLSKVSIYNAVQAAGAKVPGMRKAAVSLPLGQRVVAAVGADLTSVKCAGAWMTVGVSVDAVGGGVLSIDVLESGERANLIAWLEEIASAVGADLVVTDDADGFKAAADAAGLKHQVCKAHVVRNTEAWVERLEQELASGENASLPEIGVSVEQARKDGQTILRLVRERQPSPEATATLRAIHRRYQSARSPRSQRGSGRERTTLAYRMRLFTLDRWELWKRLTCYRDWANEYGEMLDGTNNATERAIGWWVKERYRTMRGYKKQASVERVSRLIGWAGNGLNGAGVELAVVVR